MKTEERHWYSKGKKEGVARRALDDDDRNLSNRVACQTGR